MQEDITCFQGCCRRRWGFGKRTYIVKGANNKWDQLVWDNGWETDDETKMQHNIQSKTYRSVS